MAGRPTNKKKSPLKEAQAVTAWKVASLQEMTPAVFRGGPTVIIKDGKKHPAYFAVMDALFVFFASLEEPRPPGCLPPVPEKDGAFDPASLWIGEKGEKFDPAELLAATPKPRFPLPVINPADCRVIAGKTTARMIHLLWEKNPKKLEEWKSELLEAAPRFGLDSTEVAKIEIPMLVKLLEDSYGEQSYDIVKAAKRIQKEILREEQENEDTEYAFHFRNEDLPVNHPKGGRPEGATGKARAFLTHVLDREMQVGLIKASWLCPLSVYPRLPKLRDKKEKNTEWVRFIFMMAVSTRRHEGRSWGNRDGHHRTDVDEAEKWLYSWLESCMAKCSISSMRINESENGAFIDNGKQSTPFSDMAPLVGEIMDPNTNKNTYLLMPFPKLAPLVGKIMAPKTI